jgi:hypothetical protein
MQTITRTLDALELGPSITFRNLTVFPLIRREGAHPSYLTLDEALAAGTARVTEVHDAGRVPELMFENDGELPVLLLDGEELIGAKQNRVLNLTILAPAKRSIVIPVSCVEAGRWDPGVGAAFASSPQVMFHSARLGKARAVSRAMARGGSRQSDQRAVWQDVDHMAADLNAPSATSAMDEIFRRHETNLDDYVRGLPHVRDQVGGVFAIDGRVMGLELLDHPETMRKLLPKLVRSYGLDAVASRVVLREPPPVRSVREFVDEVAGADSRSVDAVGLGRDVRLSGRGLAGGGLIHDGRLVHLTAFRLEEETRSGEGRGEGRMQSFANRARRWRRSG